MKVLVTLCLVMLLSGCGTPAHDIFLCYQNVQKKFPESQVQVIPEAKYKFLVKTKQGQIYYVETMYSTSPEVSSYYLVFP